MRESDVRRIIDDAMRLGALAVVLAALIGAVVALYVTGYCVEASITIAPGLVALWLFARAYREQHRREKLQDKREQRQDLEAEADEPSAVSYDICHLPSGATSKDRTESDKQEAEDNDDN